MSFIEQSEQNVDRLMKEVTGGSVAGFVGGKGMGIDALFAGPFHPDSGHGSENEKLLQKQLKDRKKMRSNMEQEAFEDGVELVGNPSPVGGYYDVETENANLAFDEIDFYDQIHREWNNEMTPPQDLEWVEVETDLKYDEPGEAYKVRDIKYDNNSALYADENFINQSQTNWEIINKD